MALIMKPDAPKMVVRNVSQLYKHLAGVDLLLPSNANVLFGVRSIA